MPKEKKSGQKVRGENTLIKGYIPTEEYEQLRKLVPPYITRWESDTLRRIVHEWLEAQKKKGQ